MKELQEYCRQSLRHTEMVRREWKALAGLTLTALFFN